VTPHSNTYLPFYYYGSERVKQKLIFPSNPEYVEAHGMVDSGEIAMSALAKYLPIQLIPWSKLLEENPSFALTQGRYDNETWVVRALQESHYRLELAPLDHPTILYKVSAR